MRGTTCIGLILLLIGLTVIPVLGADNPILSYNFNDGTAHDSTVNGYDGTIVGATSVDVGPIFDKALSFDGVNDYVTSSQISTITDDVTVSLWMRNNHVKSYVQRMADLGTENDLGFQLCLGTDGRVCFDNIGGPGKQLYTSERYNDDKWHQITGVRRGYNYYLYVDGVQKLYATGKTSPAYNHLYVGKRAYQTNSPTTDYNFWGLIDEVQVYRRALTSEEILADYHAKTNTAPLKADFRATTSYLVVQFTDLSTGNPTSWSWDFNGDGVIDDTRQNVQYTYSNPGLYSVSLTVTNSYGSSDTKNAIILVNSRKPITLTEFKISPRPYNPYYLDGMGVVFPITVKVTNPNKIQFDGKIGLFDNGNEVQSKTINLKPSSSQTISFEPWIPNDDGLHSLTGTVNGIPAIQYDTTITKNIIMDFEPISQSDYEAEFNCGGICSAISSSMIVNYFKNHGYEDKITDTTDQIVKKQFYSLYPNGQCNSDSKKNGKLASEITDSLDKNYPCLATFIRFDKVFGTLNYLPFIAYYKPESHWAAIHGIIQQDSIDGKKIYYVWWDQKGTTRFVSDRSTFDYTVVISR